MLIGLSGKAGSGKDTAFGFIAEWAEEQGRPVRRDAFADRLKVSAARALGHEGSPEECIAFCNQLKQDGMRVVVRRRGVRGWFRHYLSISGRTYQQRYGTEAHREIFDDNFWIYPVMADYNPWTEEILVITDVRFPNEAKAVTDAGGEVWEIVRPGPTIAESDHASEQRLSPALIDRVLVNVGDVHDLRAMVRSSLTGVHA